jgi:HK97 family phage major capsid protein
VKTELELLTAIRALEEEAAGESFTRDQKTAWNEANEQLDEFRKRRDRVRTLADDPRNVEAIFDEPTGTGLPTGDLRSRALAANERAAFLPEQSREHMEHEIREDNDPEARLARYVIETSKRQYLRAFSRWVNDPVSGPHLWSPEEREAVRGVRWVERTMNLTGAQGGYLVPYELDPSILIASAGYVDPMRAISRVATTALNEKRFVTSLGVTSHWYAEEAEVTDDAPALLQPAIVCKKAMAFVPVSFELFEDSDIADQIGAVFADSKAAEEARVFTTGTGTTEPKGIVTALVAAGGSIVIATGTNVLAQGDLYANQAALPARWRPNAKFTMNLSILNGYRQLPQATGLNYSIINDDGPIPKALGWEVRENSSMDGTLTGSAADYLVLSGDFNQYAIVDRIGTSLEFIPHLMGANRRPSGQ